MFDVQPVRSKELQSQIAALLGCEFYPDTYAFFAGELDEDCKTITSVIALCQFEFSPEKAVINLVRTVMNFVYRAEIPTIVFDESAADAEFIKSLGFRNNDGEYAIDLRKFYLSPCHYNNDKK